MPGPDPNAPAVDPSTRAWLTLITRSNYLPGAIILLHTLQKHNTAHALITQYTDTLGQESIACLQQLTKLYPGKLHIQRVEPVPLPPSLKPIAKRFDDTLTKLRAFQPLPSGPSISSSTSTKGNEGVGPIFPPLQTSPKEICFLDADIAIYRPLDSIFTIPRPGRDWIAAHHACICNIDGDPWAEPSWKPENCPLTPLSHPSALDAPNASSAEEGAPETSQKLNSGVFLCTPSPELWTQINDFLQTSPLVKTFTFPDQNFLDEFFRSKWVPIGWQFNALKTHRYWHSNIWRDDEVRALHYIVDKPWEKRVDEGESGGYKGRDGEVHFWWWGEWDEWVREMEGRGKEGRSVLGFVGGLVDVESGLGKTNFE